MRANGACRDRLGRAERRLGLSVVVRGVRKLELEKENLAGQDQLA